MKLFDEFLIKDKGFTVTNSFTNKRINKIPSYSSLGMVSVKLVNDKTEVVYGLYEFHLPPTLIYPRPFIFSFEHGKYGIIDDRSFLDRYLSDLSNDEIFSCIESFYRGTPWAVVKKGDTFIPLKNHQILNKQ